MESLFLWPKGQTQASIREKASLRKVSSLNGHIQNTPRQLFQVLQIQSYCVCLKGKRYIKYIKLLSKLSLNNITTIKTILVLKNFFFFLNDLLKVKLYKKRLMLFELEVRKSIPALYENKERIIPKLLRGIFESVYDWIAMPRSTKNKNKDAYSQLCHIYSLMFFSNSHCPNKWQRTVVVGFCWISVH